MTKSHWRSLANATFSPTPSLPKSDEENLGWGFKACFVGFGEDDRRKLTVLSPVCFRVASRSGEASLFPHWRIMNIGKIICSHKLCVTYVFSDFQFEKASVPFTSISLIFKLSSGNKGFIESSSSSGLISTKPVVSLTIGPI